MRWRPKSKQHWLADGVLYWKLADFFDDPAGIDGIEVVEGHGSATDDGHVKLLELGLRAVDVRIWQ